MPDRMDYVNEWAKQIDREMKRETKITWIMDDDPIWGDCLWIDVGRINTFKKRKDVIGIYGHPYDGLVLGFGKNVFVYSVDASPIIKKEE